MPPSGSITVKLDVADGDFQAKFDKAMKTIGGFDRGTAGALQLWGRRTLAVFNGSTAAVGKMASALTSFKTILLGTLAVAGSAKFVKTFADASEYVDKIGKRAKVLAVPTEFLSALTYAAELADIDPDSLGKMAAKAMSQIAKAVEGGKKEIAGVRLLDPITGEIRSIQVLLPEFAKALANTADQAKKIHLAEQIFGRAGGPQFVQLLEETGVHLQRIPALMEQARQTGAIFTSDQVDRLTKMNDAWTRVTIGARGIRVAIVNEVAPTVEKFLNATADQLGTISNSIPKAAALIRDLAGGSQDPDRMKALGDLNAAAKDLFLVTAVEVGRVGGTAFVQALSVGFTALRPFLEEMAQDVLGPVLNQIPGIDIPKTVAGQIEDIRNSQAAVKRARGFDTLPRRIGEAEYRVKNDFGLSNEQYDQAKTTLELLKRDYAEVKEFLKTSDAEIASLKSTREAQLRTRGQDLVAALADGAKDLEATLATSRANIGQAVQTFQAAAEGVDAVYQVTHPEGNRKPPSGPSIYTVMKDYVLAGGKQLQDAMRAVTGGIDEEGKRTKSIWQKFIAMGNDFRSQSAALQARMLDAQGLDRQADRFRLVFKQAEEMRKAIAFYGSDNALVTQLRGVQSAELAQFDRGPKKEKKDEDPKTFAEGWFQAIDQIKVETKDWGVFTRDTLKSSVKGFSDSWAQALVNGEITFKNFGKKLASILGDVLKQGLSAVLSRVLYGAIGGAAGRIYGGVPTIEAQSNPTFGPPAPGSSSAYGNAFVRGNVARFAFGGHITRGPELFPMSRGRLGLRGENAQDEGVFPLVRKGGILGVRATGMGGGTTVNVIDQRSGGSPVQVRESTGAGGSKQIEVLIRDAVQKSVADGSMDRILGSTYGLRRKGTR